MGVNIEDIMAKLKIIFQKMFDEDVELSAKTSAKDVEGWDSLTHVRLMMTVERTFGIKFSAAEMASFENVGDLAAAIGSHL